MTKAQKTIDNCVEYSGVGLFSGEEVMVRFNPAGVNAGVTFVRTDLPRSPKIPVSPDNLLNSFHHTSLQRNGARVETVEHLLAVLYALGIDNLEIEMDGNEVPRGDGSPLCFFELLKDAGATEQDAGKRTFAIGDPITVNDGDMGLVALPYEKGGLSISFTFDYDCPSSAPKTESFSIEVNEDSFAQIAPARTLCMGHMVEEFQNRGLGKGATQETVIVVNDDGTYSVPLRFPDECVRHKILDLLGDLFFVNAEIYGRIIAVKSGHVLNRRLVGRILEVMDSKNDLISPVPTAITPPSLPPAEVQLDIREIQKILPHRYPFLLVDRILAIEDDKTAVGIKNVTYNETFFQGHWPDYPVMPGVLIVEAMAQLAGILLLRKLENTGKLTLLLSMDKVKVRKPVIPGDQLHLEADAVRVKSRTAQVNTRALVDSRLVAEAQLRFMLVDAEVD